MTCTVIYCRISRDATGESLGVERQERDCRNLCDLRGWENPEVIVDNDVSAYTGKARPGYERLLEGVKDGSWGRVVAWHPDRLHRSPRELEDFIDVIESSGCEVVTVTAGDFDLSTPEGRLVARITGNVARKESEDKSRRSRRKHLELAEAGREAGGGTRPFGYLDRQTIDPVEAALVMEAADRLLAGETVRGVVRDWTARGIPTVTGARWTPHVLKRLVTSGRVCGWREHHGQLIQRGMWPAILDREQVDQLRTLLRDPARQTNTNSRRYLLTGGIARCGVCGFALVARPKSGGARCYTCASSLGGCGKIRRLADLTELWVADQIAWRVDSPEYAAAVAADAGKPVEGDPLLEVRACEAKLDALAADWAADRITRGEWLAARQGVERRLQAAQRRLVAVPAHRLAPGSGKALKADWPGMSFDARRLAVVRTVARVDILPAVRGRRTFDKSRIKVTWRF